MDLEVAAISTLEDRTRLSRALNDIDMRVHSNLGSEEVLQSALDGFVAALDADAGDIKIREGDEWVVSYVRGFAPAEIGLRLEPEHAPVAVAVARTSEPMVIADYIGQEDVPYVGFPARHSLRAVLAMPLVVRGDTVGCLFAWMRAPRVFTEGEVDFARRMAASVALALANARLYEGEREARRRAEAAERRLGQELNRTHVLLRASDELTSTNDPDELLRRLARIVLDATGITRAFVNLIDMNAGVLMPRIATGGLAQPTGESVSLDALSETAFEAIHRRKTVVLDYDREGVPERDRAIAAANEARLVLFVPLLHGGEIIGHISVDQPGERYDFSAEQVQLINGIAAFAGVALHNAQEYEREHRIAETLQKALIAPPESVEGVEVSSLYRPASAWAAIGGDFYDVFALGHGHIALVVGDVTGKGIQAAQMTALIRDGLRSYLLEDSDPGGCLTRLNRLVHRFSPDTMFATVFLGVLDCATGAMRFSNAGHPPPVVMDEAATRVVEPHSAVLGAFAETTFSTHETALSPGEVLVVVTDGVTEARGDIEMLGEQGLVRLLSSARGVPVADLPAYVLSGAVEFGGGRLHDDVVVLCAAIAPHSCPE